MDDLRAALRDSLGRSRWALAALGAVVAAFLLLPVVLIVPQSFTTRGFLAFPPHLLSTRWYDTITSDPAWTNAFGSSLRLTAVGGAIATLTGTLAALAVRRRRGASSWLTTAFLVPLVIPQVVYAVGLYLMYQHLGVVGQGWAVAAGQAVLAFPVVFVTVSAALAATDPLLGRAAASLGDRWWRVATRVDVPLVRLSILAGGLFALALCFDEFVVALFTTSPENQTLPVQIYTEALSAVSPAIAAASTVVMAAAVVVYGLGSRLLAVRRRAR
jgi:putative spermidine/putrescine transport system permease protein